MSVLDELEPPTRPDFRRVGNGVPYVVGPDGKRIRYKRSSSAGKILDDEGGLVDWQKRTIVEGAAQRPDLMAIVSTLDPDADKKQIRDITEECLVSGKGTHRATTGTAIHRMLDRVDMGDDWTPAPQFAAAVDAYVTARDAYGLVVVDIEVHCVNDEFQCAGTMDRRYRTTRQLITPTGEMVPIGSVLAGDTKTGRSLEYASGSYATQLAAYAGSVRYDVATDERTAFDPPTFPDWALIMHVDADAGRCDVYWIDLQAGREGLALAQRVREWRKRTDLIVPARAPLRVVPPAPATTPVETPADASAPDAAVLADRAAMDALGALRTWLRARIANVRAAGDAPVAHLQRIWPAGVAGLKWDTQTESELDDISDALWRVEAEYGLTFPEADPRQEPERVFADRWAAPKDDDPPDSEAVYRLTEMIMEHPRQALIRQWAGICDISDGANREALGHALYEFAMLPVADWSDDDVTEMLDGTLRAMGFDDGLMQLGQVSPNDAPLIMASAFAITAGTALLLYDAQGRPVVRNIER